MSSLTTISRRKNREKTTAFIAPMTVSDSVSGTTSYTTNNLNQYTNIAALVPIYDNNGNLTNLNGWTYSYDAQNRLLSVQSASSAEVFSYDPQNRCVSRSLTVSGTTTTTNFFYDGWQLAEELDASGTEQALYVSGANVDELLYKATSAATVFYQHDGLGSTTALTDANGNLLERYTYDVFGKPAILDANNNPLTTSAYGNRHLFTGREYLQEVGLYDYRNRIYSADLGRFLQTDPMRFSAGDVNVYRYCGNDILDKNDEDGLSWLSSVAEAGRLTMNWAYGIGENYDFYGPNSDQANDMKNAPGIESAREAFRKKNKGCKCCEKLKSLSQYRVPFGAKGYVAAGTNPTRQFTGGFSVLILPYGGKSKGGGVGGGVCKIEIITYNETTLRSALADIPLIPKYERYNVFFPFPIPGGTTRQNIEWTENYKL